MCQPLLCSIQSPLRQFFWKLPYAWQLKLILLSWEVQYRRRRRTWCWAGSSLSTANPSFGVGQPDFVSVVLPVYNQAETLIAAVDTILGQSYPHFELLIVNDGSTDQTPQILKQYAADPRVTIIHQSNQRLPTALNRGFQKARGNFLTWTSGDNLMHPEQLKTLVTYLQAHPEVALAYADFELINDQGQPVKNAQAIFMRGEKGGPGVHPRHETDRLNVGFECVVGPCFMYRSFVRLLIGTYNPQLEGSEDFDYWIRINNFFRVRHIDQRRPLYYYRVHQHRMSTRLKPRISQQRRWLMNREQEFQRRLAQPVAVAVDAYSFEQLIRSQPIHQALPPLTFALLPQNLSETTFAPQAILVHHASLTLSIIDHCRHSHCLLLCWFKPDDSRSDSFEQLRGQVDLLLSFGYGSDWGLDNVLVAATLADLYHLIRIFVAARLNEHVSEEAL